MFPSTYIVVLEWVRRMVDYNELADCFELALECTIYDCPTAMALSDNVRVWETRKDLLCMNQWQSGWLSLSWFSLDNCTEYFLVLGTGMKLTGECLDADLQLVIRLTPGESHYLNKRKSIMMAHSAHRHDRSLLPSALPDAEMSK